MNSFWSPFPTKQCTKTPQNLLGKFGAKFGTKIRDKNSFCNFSDLTFQNRYITLDLCVACHHVMYHVPSSPSNFRMWQARPGTGRWPFLEWHCTPSCVTAVSPWNENFRVPHKNPEGPRIERIQSREAILKKKSFLYRMKCLIENGFFIPSPSLAAEK